MVSDLGAALWALLFLALVVWTFWRAGGPPPKDTKIHKKAQKYGKRFRIRGVPTRRW